MTRKRHGGAVVIDDQQGGYRGMGVKAPFADPVTARVMEKMEDGRRKREDAEAARLAKAKSRITLKKFSWED